MKSSQQKRRNSSSVFDRRITVKEAEADLDKFKKWITENSRFKERAVVKELKRYNNGNHRTAKFVQA